MFYLDYYYFILIIPAMLIALFAQMKVKTTYAKYNQVRCQSGLTAAQVARKILDSNGLQHIPIEHIRGELTDHFDPRSNTIRLSDSVYSSSSIGAIGVAAHECGHAVQHAVGYAPLKIRSAIIPVTNIGSQLSFPLILMGIIFSAQPLVTIGIVAFSLVVVFQLVTLPVEFDASGRALTTLSADGYLNGEEVEGARKVLSAAALTYVAALITAVAQLLRLVLLYGRRNRRN